MSTRYTKTVTILPSRLDVSGRLSVPDTFDLFMDVATEAADEMGLGWAFLMKKGLFWITVKTRVRFISSPQLLQAVEVSTWPEPPQGKRCVRQYEITRDGETLVQGKTEWAIVSALTRRPQDMARIIPEGVAYDGAPGLTEPFPMIDEAFPEPPFAEHTVKALDIDMARHMNNVAYVRAIVNAFSVKAWKKLDVRQMDVIFRASAHEGDVIRFQQRREKGIVDIRGSLADGTTVVLSRLWTGN